jgi:ABC-type transport system involved in multi-copper enzyme maturation permease subunit
MAKERKYEDYWAGLPDRGISIIRHTVRQILFSRWIVLALAILLIPAFIGIYAIFRPPQDFKPMELFFNLGLYLFLQFFVLLYSLIYATSLVYEEMEKLTITYLISRPMKRLEVAVFKFIGYLISLNILFIFSILVTYVVFSVPDNFADFTANLGSVFILILIMFLGSLAYGALFMFFGTVFKWPLMIGILFAFIWEIFIINIGGNIKKVTIMYYLRSIFYQEIGIGDILNQTKMETTQFSVIVLLVVLAVFLLLSCYVISRKDMN